MNGKIAVIGASGFIGAHLVRLLREKSLPLVLLARNASKDGQEVIHAFTTDMNKLSAILKGCDVAYYLISETIPASSWEDPKRELDGNLAPFLRFLEVSALCGVRKIVFVSSGGTVYGTTQGRVGEDHDKKPFSPYGIMKLTMENFLRYAQVRSGINHDIYRISNVYGEGQDTRKGLGIINTFLESIVEKGDVNVYGDGSSTRNYIYVNDVCEVLIGSLKDPARSDIFNLSSPDTLDINALLKIMKEVLPDPFQVNYLPGRKSDNPFIDLDNTRLLNSLGGFGFTPLHEGILNTYRHIKVKLQKTHG